MHGEWTFLKLCAFYPIRWLGLFFCKIFFRVGIYGRKSVPRRGAVLFTPNHTSFMDGPLLQLVSPRRINFLVADKAFNLWTKFFLHVGGCVPVSREVSNVRTFRVALKLLEENRAIGIFPEGGISRDGALRQPQPGAAALALKTGACVVPVYIEGSRRALPPGSYVIRPRKVRVFFGEPVRFKEDPSRPRKERDRAVAEEIMKKISELMSKADEEM